MALETRIINCEQCGTAHYSDEQCPNGMSDDTYSDWAELESIAEYSYHRA